MKDLTSRDAGIYASLKWFWHWPGGGYTIDAVLGSTLQDFHKWRRESMELPGLYDAKVGDMGMYYVKI